LRWESAHQVDIGLDFAFFSSKLSGSIDYYNRKTSNLLYNVPQPLSSGFAGRTENVGSMRNTGMEFAVNGVIMESADLKVDDNTNITAVKTTVLRSGNVVLCLSSGPGLIGQDSRLRPGASMR